MFQYAAGRALSSRLGQQLRLDVSGFVNYRLHNGFELPHLFNGTMDVATPEDMQRVLGWQAMPSIRKLLLRPELAVLRSNKFVVEPHFHYCSELDRLSGDCYLMGYWQSEKYFKSIESIIRADFVFRQPMSERNQQIADEITQSNAVSLHVRRGDYVQNTNTFATHGACSLDYYRAAILRIAERVEQPKFFIFSDDITWVKGNMKIDFPCQYVDHNCGGESYNDMRLMSLCKHNIIANSSFSWWGAWLNPRADKIVIAPKCWFANQTNVQDLFPPGWLTL